MMRYNSKIKLAKIYEWEYQFTGIDHYTKVAFARMYKRASSYNATDFLNRLLYLTDGKIENIQTDNGSEFAKYFEKACQQYQLERYYNRPQTPKDNSINERFNKTVEEEFISLGNFTANISVFNRNLTDWLIDPDSLTSQDRIQL